MEDTDEVECGACADTVPKVSAVAAGWKLVMDTHYDMDMGQPILVHEWQCGSCAPGAHSENTPGNGTSGGVELTDEVIEHLTDEAEHGYPTERLRSRGEGTDADRARQLRERAAIERAEATEMESDMDVSPNRAMVARQARELARNYDRAADRLDPDQGGTTSLLAGRIILVSYVRIPLTRVYTAQTSTNDTR